MEQRLAAESFHPQLTAYLAAKNLQLLALERLTGGWASGVYALEVQSREAGARPEGLILKTYPPTEKGHDTALREWQALQRLHAAAYPVPAVRLLDQDIRHLSCLFIMMQRSLGKPLWHSYEQAEQAQQQELVRFFAGLLVKLHMLDPNLLEPSAMQAAPYAYIERELAGLRHSGEHSSHASLLYVVDWLERHKQLIACRQPVILHRDYHPWNVLVDNNGQATVIDWDWQVGDFRFDLAWTLTLMQRSGFHDFSAAFSQAYAVKSGRSLEGLEVFEVLTSLRWLYNVTTSLQVGEEPGSAVRKGFREFLLEPVRNSVTLIQQRTGLELEVAI